MKSTNKLGLNSDIPSEIKREVRQRSGFGCVMCGAAILQYHHYRPPFPDASAHTADGITALCPTCHTKVTNRRISTSDLLKAVNDPHCLRKGFSHDQLALGVPAVVFGNVPIVGTPIILEVCGRSLLSVSPFGLNAFFYNKEGAPIAEIVENEWRAFSSNWDVETVGQRTTIRNERADIALVFRIEPPATVVIELLNMYYHRLHLIGKENAEFPFSILLPDGSPGVRFGPSAIIAGCEKGIVFECPACAS